MTTITALNTIEDIDALFDTAAANHVEFDTIAEARAFIIEEGLPFAASFTISRKSSGMADRVGVRLP